MGGVLKAPMAMFGIGQKDDPTYNPNNANSAMDQMNQRNGLGGEAGLQSALSKYGDGSQSFNDAINAGGFSGAQSDELRNRLMTDGQTGTKFASEQVQSNPMTQGLFGAGGLQDRLGTEEKDLAGRGYGLQQQDHEAYGQAAGDIARQFGQQESDTANSLNRRGLGGASSGAAGAAFSGLQGNKNEMLAKAQTDIAQKRMADTNQRLQATRQMMGTLGAQGQQAVQSQFDRQMAGANANNSNLQSAAKLQMGQNSAANDAGRQANEDAIGHKSKNIGDAWAEGKYSGTKSGEADATSSWMKMGGSSSMGMSDENNKTNISDGGPKVRNFLKGIATSHDYTSAKPASGGGGGSSPQSGGMGGKPPWAAGLQQPGKDGTYKPSAMENANLERGTSGLGAMQDGSGGMTQGGATQDSGLTSMLGGMGGGSSGAGSGGMGELASMFSDENDKKDIHGGSGEVRNFLDHVSPHSYEYKDQFKSGLGGPGHYVSPMAQELEQTDLGADMVKDTPDGKVVDYGKGFGTLLAGMADVNKRLSAIEGRK